MFDDDDDEEEGKLARKLVVIVLRILVEDTDHTSKPRRTHVTLSMMLLTHMHNNCMGRDFGDAFFFLARHALLYHK